MEREAWFDVKCLLRFWFLEGFTRLKSTQSVRLLRGQEAPVIVTRGAREAIL